MAALLRVNNEDRHVLFSSVTRPGAFGPPSDVVEYMTWSSATKRPSPSSNTSGSSPRAAPAPKCDTTFAAPAPPGGGSWASSPELQRGTDREAATECLRHELVEDWASRAHVVLPRPAFLAGDRRVREHIAPLSRGITVACALVRSPPDHESCADPP
ncbi:hypothetical protein [Streptomyces sp. NPDC091278]|uniref:hypothetical protein n=1 Tax=Streptomyces sp. NPDC091278 TaxID=3155301 RepID=UPI00344FC942